MLSKMVMMLKKQFFQECGARIENYISFTNPPEFKINPDYPYENDLERYGIDISQLTEEDYNKAVAQLKNEVQNCFRI
jgi:hypothetical protein